MPQRKYCLFLILIVLFFACRKTDIATNSITLPPLLDSISITGFPAVSFSIQTDTIPYKITNNTNLPYQSLDRPIAVHFHTIHTTKVQIEQTDKNNNLTTNSYKPDSKSGDITANIDASGKLVIRLYDNDFSSVYLVNLHANQLPDPVFTKLDILLNPNGTTPLAGQLAIVADEPVTVSYVVQGQDGEDYKKQCGSTDNNGQGRVALFGLYANYNNQVTVSITNTEGSSTTKQVWVQTDALPSRFPDSTDIVVRKADTANSKSRFILYYPYRTVGGMPFNSPGNNAYPIVIDRFGKVRWYSTNPFVMDMKPMPNGHFLQYYYNYVFREVDLLGNVYNEIIPPYLCHHDFQLLPNGNILYTADDASVNGTTEDKIYEMDFHTGNIVKTFNLYDVLDPTRPQDPFIPSAPKDWFHNNSLAYDSTDNSILVTGRHQSAICKIDYATGQLKWIVSDPTYWKAPWSNYLLTPTGSGFEYAWGQHSVVLNPSDHNTFLVFDNGNTRSYTQPVPAINNYSRLVEFRVDPSTGTVTQTFESGKEYGSENYSPALGSVDYVGANLFVCYPLVLRDANGRPSEGAGSPGTPGIRFMETDRNKNIVLDIEIRNRKNPQNGYRTYRGHPFSF